MGCVASAGFQTSLPHMQNFSTWFNFFYLFCMFSYIPTFTSHLNRIAMTEFCLLKQKRVTVQQCLTLWLFTSGARVQSLALACGLVCGHKVGQILQFVLEVRKWKHLKLCQWERSSIGFVGDWIKFSCFFLNEGKETWYFISNKKCLNYCIEIIVDSRFSTDLMNAVLKISEQ